MHDHFEEGDGGDADVLEVVRVVLPGSLASDGILFFFVVAIKRVSVGIYKFDGVFEFCRYFSKPMPQWIWTAENPPQAFCELSMVCVK